MSFPAYDEYKDSGRTWLGKVPAHWKLKPLWTFYRRTKRTGHEGEELLSVYRDYGVIPKSSRDDNFNKPSEDLSPYQLVEPSDLVINKMKAWQGSVAVSEYRGIVSPAYHVFECLHDQDSRYLHYLMRSLRYITGYLLVSKGIRVNQWDLEPQQHTRMPLLVPPLDEQKTISSFLDVETSKIDGLVSEQRSLIELLREKRQAVISHAVIKGLNPNAPMKPSGIQWLGDVPQHWDVNRVKYLTRILRGKFTHRPRNDPRMYDGPYPFIQTGEISPVSRYVGEHHQTLSEEGFKVSKQFPAGTLVMTITGAGTANVAILNFEACFPDSIVGFVPTEGVSIDYLYNLFIAMREALLSTAVTNTQPNLNIERIGALLTVKPPLDEQEEIVETIERASGNYSTLIAEAERAIELLQERRTALISAAVTGKIDVRELVRTEAVA